MSALSVVATSWVVAEAPRIWKGWCNAGCGPGGACAAAGYGAAGAAAAAVAVPPLGWPAAWMWE